MIDKIGNRLVHSLKPKAKPYQVHDSELQRFFIRVQPSGIMIYGCSVTLPGGRRSTRLIGRHGVFTPAQARDNAKHLLADITKGIDPDAAKRALGGKTLEAFLDDDYDPWLKSRQKNGEKSNDPKVKARALATLAMIRTSFPAFLPKKLSEISPWLIEKWKINTLNAGAKPATVNRKMDALRAVFTKAIKWSKNDGAQVKNPFSDVDWCELDDNSVVRYLSDEEAARLEIILFNREKKIRTDRKHANLWRTERNYPLLPDLDGVFFADYLLPMVRLSRNLGVRRAELFHLERKHVDLGSRVVTIIGDNSKNGRTRYLPLNQIAFETLKNWIDQSRITEGFIFPGENGNPMNNVNKSWKAALKASQIHRFRWHDMRHDFASRLVMAGVDLNTVRELLGHSDLKMTIRYAHLAPHVKADAVSKLDDNVRGRELKQDGIQISVLG